MSDQPPESSIDHNGKQSSNIKKQIEEQKQKEELKDLLHTIDTDGAPQLKSKITVLSEPKLDELEISQIKKLHLKDSPLREKDSVPDNERPTGNLWRDLEIFFIQLGRAYENRYALWESTFVSIMKNLRKMRKYNETQSQILIDTIQELEIQIKNGLKDFQIRRDEMERFSDIDYKTIALNFKKALELLNLQIREIQLRQEIDQLYQIYCT
ncbi:MAG: hypothetical protein K9W44_16145 [Candidatus Lokiarchaeota archaeon]|nr:hypothetical protein [Candidatus Harpocratesius repetitus]